MSKTMEEIKSDRYDVDFALSLNLLKFITTSLEVFIRGENLQSVVHEGPNVISSWAARNGATNHAIIGELDLIVASLWSRFKPLVETIITERPPNLGLDDLDFRCTRRIIELGELKALGTKSALYSIYLDTFYSEFYFHCLLRKLALIKLKGIAPTPLVKQFVDIYLNLPALDPTKFTTKEAYELTINELLVNRAGQFNLQRVYMDNGPLSAAARLIVDPRISLSLAPNDVQTLQIIQEFERDCRQLTAIWSDFDDFVRALATDTSTIESLNSKIKFAVPQLIYGTICSLLLELPR